MTMQTISEICAIIAFILSIVGVGYLVSAYRCIKKTEKKLKGFEETYKK